MRNIPFTQELGESITDLSKAELETARLLATQCLANESMFRIWCLYQIMGHDDPVAEAESFREWVFRNLELSSGDEMEAEAARIIAEVCDEIVETVRSSSQPPLEATR